MRNQGQGHIRQRGKQSWELKFDLGRDPATGKRITQFHTFRGTRKQAQFKLAELIASVGKGAYVNRSDLTVHEHVRARIEQWQALEKITPKTAERYRELLENQIAPHAGEAALQKLKPADIERWHATLKKRGRKDGGGLGARTIRHAHRLLSKALKEAMRHDLVVRNAAAAEPPPQVEAEEIVVLDGDQIKSLVEKLRGRAMYPRVITALFTGVRRGELLALRWRDLDLETKEPSLRVREAIEETKAGLRLKTPKTENSVREISLPDIVVEALREHRRQQREQRVALGLGKLLDDALLFPKLDGSPQSPRAFSKEWADVAASIGLPVTFHALRHTHASHLNDAGIDVVKISRRLAHASVDITLRVYAHLFRKRDDKSSAAINAAVASLFQG
jgi:integrase